MADEQFTNKRVTTPDDPALKAIGEQAVYIIQTCFDPEIPVNIWELGLVYEVNIKDSQHIEVIMSLTSPFCPAAQSLPEEVKNKLEGIPGVNEATVEITFDPPWTTEMMSEEAKLELGFM